MQNHDLDFGVPKFSELASQCVFPWLLANVLDPALGTDVPLGNAKPTLLLSAANGIKIGVIGLVEREWLDTINTLPPNLIYKSASGTAQEWASRLRAQGADLIVALTHQREPNDLKIAEKCPPGTIDIILGGHDHFYGHGIVNGVHLLRSGTDFKQLSYLEGWRSRTGKWDFTIHRREIVRSIPEEPQAAALVERLSSKLKTKLEKPIGYTAAPLDARFTTVRLRESNYGNLVCDIMRLYYGADCTIMASGTIRGDQVYPPGVLRLKDIMDCYPFEDPVVVLRVSGEGIHAALENSVSTYPAQEGRFPQVSNIRFTFDGKAAPMHRVKAVVIGGQPLDPTRKYLLATRDYMARGKDGFSSLLYAENGGPAETVVSEENGILISMLLRQYFTSLKVMAALQRAHNHDHDHGPMDVHWATVHETLHAAHPLKYPARSSAPATQPRVEAPSRIDQAPAESARDDAHPALATADAVDAAAPGPAERTMAATEAADDGAETRRKHLARATLRHWRRVARIQRLPDCAHAEEATVAVAWTRGVAPRVEGRITIVNGLV